MIRCARPRVQVGRLRINEQQKNNSVPYDSVPPFCWDKRFKQKAAKEAKDFQIASCVRFRG